MFDFVYEKERGKEEKRRIQGKPEQWRKRHMHISFCDVVRGASRRRDRQTNRWTDGDAAGNYVTRTERPRNRNFCPPFLSFPFSFLLFHVYYPFYYPFGASGSRCLSFCPLANAGQLPVPIVFCFNGRSLPRIRFRETDSHVSGEHRWKVNTAPILLIFTLSFIFVSSTSALFSIFYNFFNQFRRNFSLKNIGERFIRNANNLILKKICKIFFMIYV